MSSDVSRIMNLARVRQYNKEDQEDLAQETWLRSIATGHQNEPKYMTGVLKNTLLKTIGKKITQDRYAKDIVIAYYSKDNSLADAHLKEDITKCVKYLSTTQKRIFDEIERNPEGTPEEWAENLKLERRNLSYHLINIRSVFKNLLEENILPTYSIEFLKDRDSRSISMSGRHKKNKPVLPKKKRLTKEEVNEIRSSDLCPGDLMRKYSASYTTIYKICNKKGQYA